MDDAAGRGARPTIYDIARLAGVAPSTVSRTFSRPGRVNAQTAERIRQIADEIGYNTNPLARALPTGRTSLLGLVVGDVTNPFFFEIQRGAEARAAKSGYTLLLANTRESQVTERDAIDRVIPLVEGLILVSTRMPDSSLRVVAKQRPTVVLNRAMRDVLNVTPDNPSGIRSAVTHLAELGHTSITYLAGPDASWSNGVRWRTLRDTAAEHGIRARRLGPFSPTYEGGATAATEFLENPTTAVLAFNDLMAMGAMTTLTQNGFHIPRDVSIVGIDDIFASALCSPPLTSIAAPLYQLGGIAARLLLDDIQASHEGARSPVRPTVVPTKLNIRDSTGPAPANAPTPHPSDELSPEVEELIARVAEVLGEPGRLGIAFSGGVDSAVLLAVATRILGPDRVLAILGVSPSLATRERQIAHEVAAAIGAPLIELETHEGDSEQYRANRPDRCFHCKDELFALITEQVVTKHGLTAVAYGENADDVLRPDRPGAQAATNHRVLRPLAAAGLTKEDVRTIARELGLAVADKPAAPCLASRIPHFQEVTPEKLAQIDTAEQAVRDLGFSDVRVRHHGDIARIELPDSELSRALQPEVRSELNRSLRAIGFRYVTIDAAGIQSGAFTLPLVVKND